MMIYKTGDILKENVEAIVNTVNCVGVMGRGIALQFKKTFPKNFKSYAAACKRKEVEPGQMFIFETENMMNPKYIINFPTKRHWRGKSRMADIEAGLVALVADIRARGIRSIAIPPLGAGLGGLHWPEVRARIEAALGGLDDIKVVVFEPLEQQAERGRVNPSTDVPSMTHANASLIALMRRYIRGGLDPFVSLLEVHKLMYFLQEAGEPLKLNYQKETYGPYAKNLRHVLLRVEGHFITGYGDGGDDPQKTLELLPKAVEDAESFLEDNEDTSLHLGRVSELVDGFESPFGLELLSTVHWVASKQKPASDDGLIAQVHGWNPRKEKMTPRQIRLAHDVLCRKGWCSPMQA